jgi:hypothetical protein
MNNIQTGVTASLIHPLFHVFQLKPFMTNNTPVYAELQTFASSMEPEAVPEAIF